MTARNHPISKQLQDHPPPPSAPPQVNDGVQVLARFFAARLSEMCEMSGANLISSLQAAEAEAAEASSAPGEAQNEPPAPPAAGTLTNLPPASTIPLSQDWLERIYEVVDALASLQLPAQVLAVLSAAVRQDVHEAISSLGKDWLFVPVLAAAEQYVAAAPLLLLRHLLPRMVRPLVNPVSHIVAPTLSQSLVHASGAQSLCWPQGLHPYAPLLNSCSEHLAHQRWMSSACLTAKASQPAAQ